MLKSETLINYGFGEFIRPTVCLIVSTMIVLPLISCTGNSDGGPLMSSLSTPINTAEADSASDGVTLDDAEDPGDTVLPTMDEADTNLTAAAAPDSSNVNSDEEQVAENPSPRTPTGTPVVTMNSTPTGATAAVTWQPSSDSSIKGYYIYYGKQSSGEPGVCSYEERYAVDAPSVTLTELEPNTPYFFAVSAYSILESPCSSEVMTISPPAKA